MLRSNAFLRGVTRLHTEASGTAPPDAFGPFRVLHQIGAGALGPVFRAYEPDQDRLVGVKLFRLDLPPERAHQLVAALEPLLAADLTHPSIAAPLAVGLSGTNVYLAQDFVAAESLDIVVRDHGPAPPLETLRVATQLAGALDFAAVVNVFHGALHPRDVLVSPDDVRVTGVGVAQALERVGVTPPVRRPYAAPERVAGEPWDRRADVFSLAALIFELLWGRRITAIGRDAAAMVTELPGASLERLREVFVRGLAQNPADRFPAALAFAEALRDALPMPGANPAVSVLPFEDEASLLPVATPGIPASSFEEPEARTAPPPYAVIDAPVDEPAAYDQPLHVAPAAAREVEPAPAPPPPAARRPAFSPVSESLHERRRAPVWPVLLALALGVALGFAIRDLMGDAAPPVVTEQQTAEPASDSEPPGASTATSGTASREFTERDVPPPAAATAPVAPPPESAPRAAAPTAPAAPPAARASGSLLVRSIPAGARVYVNGRAVGQAPVTIRQLARGAHTVRATRDGYAAEERRVTLTAARPSQAITLELDPVRAATAPASPGRFLGTLMVDSRPAGASVYLNGKLMGKTPLELPEVNAGTHAVRLELDGYTRWTASVRVVAGERNRVAASLER